MTTAAWCDCDLPPGSTYFHCRVCCTTFRRVEDFDSHRIDGFCHDLDGFYEEDGLYSDVEGHNRVELLKARMAVARESRSRRA